MGCYWFEFSGETLENKGNVVLSLLLGISNFCKQCVQYMSFFAEATNYLGPQWDELFSLKIRCSSSSLGWLLGIWVDVWMRGGAVVLSFCFFSEHVLLFSYVLLIDTATWSSSSLEKSHRKCGLASSQLRVLATRSPGHLLPKQVWGAEERKDPFAPSIPAATKRSLCTGTEWNLLAAECFKQCSCNMLHARL